MKIVNTDTGEDITRSVIDLLEKKITVSEFESVVGLSPEETVLENKA